MGWLNLTLSRSRERHVRLDLGELGEVWVTLLGVDQGGKVKLGFLAAEEIPIARGRVLERQGRPCTPPGWRGE